MKPYTITFNLPNSGRPVVAELMAENEEEARKNFINGHAELEKLKITITQCTAKDWMEKNPQKDVVGWEVMRPKRGGGSKFHR